jgi:hypothetical protein
MGRIARARTVSIAPEGYTRWRLPDTSWLIQLLVPLLLVFLLFDLEYTVSIIQGQGERLRHSMILVNGALVPAGFVNVPVKMSDLIIFIIIIVLLIRFIVYRALPIVERTDLYHHGFLVLFAGIGFSGLLLNAASYTTAQFSVSLLYLAKFLEVSLTYLFVQAFFKAGGSVPGLLRPVVIAGLVAAILGLFYSLGGLSAGWLFQDRVQFFGILTLLAIICLGIVLSPDFIQPIIGLSRKNLWLITALMTVSVYACGKRTVIVGFMSGVTYLHAKYLNRGNWRNIVLSYLVFLVVGLPFLLEQVTRSFFTRESKHIWEGLAPEYSARLMESPLAPVSMPGLDYSITERFGRWFVAFDRFLEHPFMGIGFFGSPYVYNFLPDSAFLQVMVETGIIGALVVAVFMVRSWLFSNTAEGMAYGRELGIGFKGAFVAIMVMGVAANTFYTFSLLGFFLAMAAVSRHANAGMR